MITIKNLTKIFRTEELETSALSGINLQINEGDFLSIMGPSGCGKSTLLNIVGLLDSASGGSYTLLNQEMIDQKKGRSSVRRKILDLFSEF
jgi:putative ABC transport system ATP-binding protein